MQYAEYAPAADLCPWVDRYWSIEDPSPEVSAQCVLPDGHPEWVVHLGEPFAGQGSCLTIGQMTGPVPLCATGPLRVFGIRFRPEGAFAFTGFDQSALTNRVCDGSAIAPRWRECAGNGDPVRVTDEMLRGLLRHGADRRVSTAVDLLMTGWPVDAAAYQCNWSSRQLERVIVTRVGLPPKLLARLGRFQRALRLRGQRLDWAAVAAAAGFADQSHLVRDFRQFAGSAPGSLERPALTEALVR
jgi:AraC-like DNA-binding protein